MASQLKSQDPDGDSPFKTTVLSRLGASKKESPQNLHTHTVESAIQLLRNNRVLNDRPLPIADEEQRLNRKQRCTLSQLRSGHCHLLQNYTHRVFGEPSGISTDCGASPQDVRQLVNVLRTQKVEQISAAAVLSSSLDPSVKTGV